MTELHKPVTPAPGNVTVRSLDRRTKPLVEGMIGLFAQGQLPHHQSFPEHFGPGDNLAAITAFLQGFLKPRNPFRTRTGFAKGMFVEEKLAGYLLYRLRQTHDVFYGKPRWHCHIEDIVVDVDARGLGGASALMSALLADVKQLDECLVSGAVWDGNVASQTMFQKHGFKPLSQSFYQVTP